MRHQSNEHAKIVKAIKDLTNGLTNDNSHYKKGGYYADVCTSQTDYEVEILNKAIKMKRKATKWDKGKKKTLVLGLEDDVLNIFDKIYFYHNDKFVRIK